MLKGPQLLINEQQCKANIKKMAAKIPQGVIFRPHFKTHQSAHTGNYFRDFHTDKITVSSLDMAAFFLKHGWKDMTLGITCNPNLAADINEIGKHAKINIVVEDEIVLGKLIKDVNVECGVFIKVDTGAGRTGVQSSNFIAIDGLVRMLKNADKLLFKGFLTHAGHTYACKNKEDIIKIYFETHAQMSALKKRYIGDFPDIILSYGDTPSCSIVDTLSHFDEYRPGNFVYYDLMQYEAGICKYDEIALKVAAPVLAKHVDRLEIVVHCGAVHLSKEFLEIDGVRVYGEVDFQENRNNVPRAFVKRLSQEHGIIELNREAINRINVGDTITIIPVHSCLTAHQFTGFL